MDSNSREYLLKAYKNHRRLSVIVLALFSSWLLSFAFEGQVLYALSQRYGSEPLALVFESIAAHFAGLVLSGFIVKSIKAAKKLMFFTIAFCFVASSVFFYAPSFLWSVALVLCAFLAGACVAAWGYYFKEFTLAEERIITAGELLIYSSVFMIIINTVAIHLSPYLGLGLSMLFLGCSLFFSAHLPEKSEHLNNAPLEKGEKNISIVKPLSSLWLFIMIITINSGLMYQVVNPAFEHHQWLISWYWTVPYIVAIFVVKNLPKETNRTYILYVAIAMMGLSFLAFMVFDRSVYSYLLINTLMLGACGVFDLFWWSILGEMLDLDNNPAKILGIGLSANVLGVLTGGFIGSKFIAGNFSNQNPAILALTITFIILIILPLLHKQLSELLKNHVFLTILGGMLKTHQNDEKDTVLKGLLTERESEIALLLFKGKTYKMIAQELYLSENTIKTHIKNIYSKLNIKSRMELVNFMIEKEEQPKTH